ncbi:SEL1-like repeat protein [Massilia sp. PAMC28688]|uniref:tetratricopeptide repeat protein n=1 Tax=Massilia sp. PAMC28688 TaxID=2861283 RepID=UPI001C633391|nr:SEL1-like repeat protein [Massilia sp. PAMC28688]QYF92203.1 SEL1-like repeat protein [Massilia sp. PAMC28688]
MKKYLLCLSLLMCTVAHADDLADAKALFAKKSYPEALKLYTKAANAGSAEAQLHLGEMHLYGEAGAIDLAKAEAWFKKAAAKGNKTAVAALEMMKQREVRKDDIAYWMSKYDGAELKSGKFRCPAPRIPAMSKQNDEISAVAEKVQGWQACYNGFVENINASSPLTKLIPKDVADLMTKDEMDAAGKHLEGVQARIVEEARVGSKMLLADYAAWRDATDAYVREHNKMVEGARK